MLFYGRQAVGNGSDAAALNVVGIVARTAVVIVFYIFDTVPDDDRKKRRRGIDGIHAFDDVVDLDFQKDCI